MRVLFVHHSFPGPFRHIAARFGAMPDTTVLFLSEYRRREVRLPGVRHLTVQGLRKSEAIADLDEAEQDFVRLLRRGARTANALLRLRRDGFVPDIIYASSGMGNAFYLRDIFPKAFLVVHADWYYNKSDNYTFFNRGQARSPVDFAPARIRNLYQLNALADCDLLVTSTEWQRCQYPQPFADRIHVVHDGVDAQFFSPRSGSKFVIDGLDLSHVQELVTFSGRSLEPSRGFPQFYRCLPRLLAARPDCHVLAMIDIPEHRKKEEEHAAAAQLAALQQQYPVDPSRVHIIGFRPYADYRQLLRASGVHVYLTAPFALSSGLFEAMSCGCLLVGSDTAPVREVVQHGHNGFLCDFWETEALADTIADLLARAPSLHGVREAARNTILERYDLKKLVPHHLSLLSSAYTQWKQSAPAQGREAS